MLYVAANTDLQSGLVPVIQRAGNNNKVATLTISFGGVSGISAPVRMRFSTRSMNRPLERASPPLPRTLQPRGATPGLRHCSRRFK